MTDTNTLAPTDAQISALAKETRTEPFRDGYILPIPFARSVLAKWGAQPFAVPNAQKTAENVHVSSEVYKKAQESNMSALAGMEPVARIEGIDEYGPRLEWLQHWVDVGVGANLFTAAQVHAMLAQGLAPGWQAAPAGRATAKMVLAASHAHMTDGASYSDIWAAMLTAAPSGPAREPLTAEQRRRMLDRLGSGADGLDGETWDQMVIDAVERHHGIPAAQKGGPP